MCPPIYPPHWRGDRVFYLRLQEWRGEGVRYQRLWVVSTQSYIYIYDSALSCTLDTYWISLTGVTIQKKKMSKGAGLLKVRQNNSVWCSKTVFAVWLRKHAARPLTAPLRPGGRGAAGRRRGPLFMKHRTHISLLLMRHEIHFFFTYMSFNLKKKIVT